MSLPPTTVTTPEREVSTACLRERSARGTVGAQQRPQPGERAGDVGAGERAGQAGRSGGEQEVDLVGGRHRYVGRVAVDRHVGEADVDETVGLGQDVDELGMPPGHRQRERGPEARQRAGPEHEVGAAAGPELHVVDQAAGPDAGGVDHRAGRDLDGLPGQLVAQHGPVAGQLDRPGTGAQVGAEAGGGPSDGRHEAGVVLELTVPGEQGAANVAPETGREQPGLRRGDPTRARQGAAAGAGGDPQQVAGADAGPQQRGQLVAGRVGERHHHRQRPGQVGRRGLEEDAALDGALVGDADLSGGEVAQAAVDQLARPARRTEGEVVGVDREHGQPAGDRVEGDADTGDPEADDQDVDPGRDVVETGPDPARGAHGVTARRTRWASSASSASSVTSSSIIVWPLSTKPCAASSRARAIVTGSPSRIEPSA